MNAVVVVESSFGNTREVARAVADGLGAGSVVVDVHQAPTVVPAEVDLIVVGGPTHAFGMSRTSTRQDAARQGAVEGGATDVGIREWIDHLGDGKELRFATFDTKVEKVRHLPGSAAKKAAKALRRRGFRMAADPMSFYVTDTPGPLVDGELERARSWGHQLMASMGSK